MVLQHKSAIHRFLVVPIEGEGRKHLRVTHDGFIYHEAYVGKKYTLYRCEKHVKVILLTLINLVLGGS